MRRIEGGDLVCFDTDLIGPYGYCADISRAWLCGDGRPSEEQRRLYAAAHEQVHHNMALLEPGVSFRELSEKSWPIPDEYLATRYSSMMHGVGLADEYPSIKYWPDFDQNGYDGILEPNMTLCVESFIATKDSREGVKLEEQVLITETGCQKLSSYPLQDDWL
jgi:Xaa-Pro aminopeptidase